VALGVGSSSRVYAEKRGRTPAKAVEAIRVDAARRRLEETDDRIESIAEACGFSNEEQMRSTFVRNPSIPPSDYRKRFCDEHDRQLKAGAILKGWWVKRSDREGSPIHDRHEVGQPRQAEVACRTLPIGDCRPAKRERESPLCGLAFREN
jgi:Helix-turn-helix domain